MTGTPHALLEKQMCGGSFVVRVCSEILLVETIDTSATKGKYGVASEDVGVSGTLCPVMNL